ncbi:hypothetical protein JZX87_13995 [Agrobacterium sp. Ap1]|uniref:hypothetical protein n=1 Tax=Agrobacterium sp. Ap1 TaxID=2815337 RepID=UPI001A8F0502|nr:hypothetical protein [Agrobacterium sp. Ap1]MBO0142275.1 hypothetical protein [Agrobacterium sp. Ap1]
MVDPDPWTIINTAACVVASFAAIAQAIKMYMPNKLGTAAPLPNAHVDQLEDGLKEGADAITRLIRILSRKDVQDKPVLSRLFSFGTSPMLLTPQENIEFNTLFGRFIQSLIKVQGSANAILVFHPDLAQTLGLATLEEFNDLPGEINGFFLGQSTNGEVLDRCLQLLRSFEQILGRATSTN